jgi:probable F420-dependent oxidoreductase
VALLSDRTERRIRFGVAATAKDLESAASLSAFARRAEDLGYATALMGDHMGRSLAPLSALLFAATATKRLRVGPQVLANDFRNPALLAKEVATIDLLTEGRFELGIGTGWPSGSPNAISDYAQLGIPLDEAGPRVNRLFESVRIIKLFLSSETPFDFSGRYFKIEGLVPAPRPSQRPRPPIMVAGAGPRMLKLCAQEVDIINLAPRPPIVGRTVRGSQGFGLTMADTVSIVREAAGRRYSEVELCVFANNPDCGNPSITNNPSPLIDQLAKEMNAPRDAIAEMPATMIGSVGELVDRIQSERDRYDISYRVIPSYAMESFAPVVARLAGT